MKHTRLALLAMVFLSGCVCVHKANVSNPTDWFGQNGPEQDSAGLVTGRTLFVTFGIPGILSGDPSNRPVPPAPVPDVEVYFKSAEGHYRVLSDSDGAYTIELPPGKYIIGWLGSSQRNREVDPFENSEGVGPEVREILVEAGKTYERDLPVRRMAID